MDFRCLQIHLNWNGSLADFVYALEIDNSAGNHIFSRHLEKRELERGIESVCIVVTLGGT